MPDDKIRVRAKGAALCPDFDGLEREPPIRRYLGRQYLEVEPGRWGFAPTNKDDVAAKRTELARAIVDGDLWPADEATANWASETIGVPVKFDPMFGASAPASSEKSKSDKSSKEAGQ